MSMTSKMTRLLLVGATYDLTMVTVLYGETGKQPSRPNILLVSSQRLSRFSFRYVAMTVRGRKQRAVLRRTAETA